MLERMREIFISRRNTGDFQNFIALGAPSLNAGLPSTMRGVGVCNYELNLNDYF